MKINRLLMLIVAIVFSGYAISQARGTITQLTTYDFSVHADCGTSQSNWVNNGTFFTKGPVTSVLFHIM